MGQTLIKPYPYPLPIKFRLGLAILSFIGRFIVRPNGTVNRGLLRLLFPPFPPSLTPIDNATSFDVTVDGTRNLWFRVFVPVGVMGGEGIRVPVIVYFHGGGFQVGSPDSKPIDAACRRLAVKVGVVVVSASYRLSPEYGWPCPYEDGFDVLRFIDREKIEGFPPNADLSQCFLMGESAGGNITHHMIVKAKDHEFKSLRIRGQISLYPFFGGEERTESELLHGESPTLTIKQSDTFWRVFLPDGSDRDHPASNVFGPRSDGLSDVEYPMTLLVVAGLDPLRDWIMRYRDGLMKYGKEVELVEYPNMIHGFAGAMEFKETSMVYNEIRGFIQKQLSSVAVED